jgi:thymidine kinase
VTDLRIKNLAAEMVAAADALEKIYAGCYACQADAEVLDGNQSP